MSLLVLSLHFWLKLSLLLNSPLTNLRDRAPEGDRSHPMKGSDASTPTWDYFRPLPIDCEMGGKHTLVEGELPAASGNTLGLEGAWDP